MPFKLSKLKILSTVYDHGSVTEAALKHGISQSTVSYSLDQLRGQLNDPLFVKVGRNLVPTAYLRERIPEIRKAISSLESLPKRSEFDRATFGGNLTILINGDENLDLTQRITQQVRQEAPLAKLRVVDVGPRENLVETIIKNRALCAVAVSFPQYQPELLEARLFTRKQTIFFDSRFRDPVQTVEDYLAASHAALDIGDHASIQLDNALHERFLKRNIAVSVPNSLVLAKTIEASDLICTMQDNLKHSVFANLDRCSVPFDIDPVQFNLFYHRRYQHDSTSKWVRTMVAEIVRSIET